MATRENQGLQIALILFVLITVALAVTTYVFWSSSNSLALKAESAESNRSTAEKERNANQFAKQLLQHMIGSPKMSEAEREAVRQDLQRSSPNVWDEMEGIEQAFEEDMKLFAESIPLESRDYRELPKHLLTTINKLNDEKSAGLQREEKLRQDLAAVTQRETGKTQVAEQGLQEVSLDRDKLRSDFQTDRAQLTSQSATLASNLATKNTEFKNQTDTFDRDRQNLEGRLRLSESHREDLLNELKDARGEGKFEIADGRITRVNQGTRTVWLNLGSDDGLRRATTFSVYDRNANSFSKETVKGSIEVVRIAEGHLAEARILDDNITDPILPGDLVHSPVWLPGRTVRFALAGFLDITGNGISDRLLVRNLILASGGEIDAEMDEQGKRTGVMSPNTRYLVLGMKPDENTAAESVGNYTAMLEEAKRFGVETIQLSQLLALMGYRGEVKTVPLGAGARSEDFSATPADGVAPTSTGNVFRERTPPGRAR